MRLVKGHVLRAWEQRKAEVCQDISDVERRAKAIQQKLDRLDEVFLFSQSIDIDTYHSHKDKLRQELTLLEIDQHADRLENGVRRERLCSNRDKHSRVQVLNPGFTCR
jgi:hypothetical protein